MNGSPTIDAGWTWPSPSDVVTPGWRSVYIGIDGPVPALGFNPWKVQWQHASPDTIIVAHPDYPKQRHRFWVYEIDRPAGRMRFAAGEYSNGVWGIQLPDPA